MIENCAFKACTALEEVTLPDTLRKIGSKSKDYGMGAFSGTGLKMINIPQNVEFIGPETFSFCQFLSKVNLPDKVTTIQEDTFSYCKKLSDICLPSGLVTIENSAFSNCDSLREIHIPVGTKKIGEGVFKGGYLKAIYIPPTVTDIGDSMTSFCSPTIYCTAGSAAMDYARKHNIKCAKAQF